MEHYVCPVCGGVSNTPKNCETAGCSLENRPLAHCTCTDQKHEQVKQQEV